MDNGRIDNVDELMGVLPDFFRDEECIMALDMVCDKVAAYSRWSNWDVAKAFGKMIRYIAGNGPDDAARKGRK